MKKALTSIPAIVIYFFGAMILITYVLSLYGIHF